MSRLAIVIMTRRNDEEAGTGETKLIDYNDSSDQKWLTGHLRWAMNNGRIVSLISTVEAK
jgi:hypothetical protein